MADGHLARRGIADRLGSLSALTDATTCLAVAQNRGGGLSRAFFCGR